MSSIMDCSSSTFPWSLAKMWARGVEEWENQEPWLGGGAWAMVRVMGWIL